MNHPTRLLIALLLAGSTATTWAVTSIKASVNGMVCAFCAQGIEKRLAKLPAAQAVYVDLQHKVVAVQAKEGQTLDAQAISAEIVEAGYDVLRVETVDQTIAQIQAGIKATAKP